MIGMSGNKLICIKDYCPISRIFYVLVRLTIPAWRSLLNITGK